MRGVKARATLATKCKMRGFGAGLVGFPGLPESGQFRWKLKPGATGYARCARPAPPRLRSGWAVYVLSHVFTLGSIATRAVTVTAISACRFWNLKRPQRDSAVSHLLLVAVNRVTAARCPRKKRNSEVWPPSSELRLPHFPVRHSSFRSGCCHGVRLCFMLRIRPASNTEGGTHEYGAKGPQH